MDEDTVDWGSPPPVDNDAAIDANEVGVDNSSTNDISPQGEGKENTINSTNEVGHGPPADLAESGVSTNDTSPQGEGKENTISNTNEVGLVQPADLGESGVDVSDHHTGRQGDTSVLSEIEKDNDDGDSMENEVVRDEDDPEGQSEDAQSPLAAEGGD